MGQQLAWPLQVRLVVHAAIVPCHADVALQVVHRKATILLGARQTLGKLVSRSRGGEHLHQAKDQDGADQQRNHQLDEGNATSLWERGASHSMVSTSNVVLGFGLLGSARASLQVNLTRAMPAT